MRRPKWVLFFSTTIRIMYSYHFSLDHKSRSSRKLALQTLNYAVQLMRQLGNIQTKLIAFSLDCDVSDSWVTYIIIDWRIGADFLKSKFASTLRFFMILTINLFIIITRYKLAAGHFQLIKHRRFARLK